MYGKLVLTFALAGFVLAGGGETPSAAAATAPAETCWVVADSNADAVDGKAEDLLSRVNRSDPNSATNEESIGKGTGTFNIEAIAIQPSTGVIFAADAGVLGTLDPDTGKFGAIGKIGSGSGSIGRLEFSDVDGLTFDPATGLLYGTQRQVPKEDLFLRIDPTTGAAVAGAIEGADYAVVPAIADLPDIDALAVDPEDGRMYAVANDDGRKDHLVRIDKATGQSTDIGVMQAQDVEGLGFASGQLMGTTGKVFREEGIWDIDKSSGAASNRRPLDNAWDYESFDCLNPPKAPVVSPSPPPPPPVEKPPTPPLAAPACLTIVEDAIPDDPQGFPFSTTGGLAPPDFVLDDHPASAIANTRTYCELAPGVYTATQKTPADWPLVGLTCDPSGGTVIDSARANASVTLAAGQSVTCVFKNTRRSAAGAPGRPAVARAPGRPAEVLSATEGPIAVPELPRTGRNDARGLVLLGGLGLALGGFGLIGGARRRSV